MALFSSETDYFGLDIGDTGIRLVQLRKSNGKPVMVTMGDAAVPGHLLSSDAPADVDKLAGIVRQLFKDLKVTTKNVVLGLPATKVYASVITTPKLTEAELSKAIKYQADQYVPIAIDQVKLDWTVLGQGKTPEELEVLLVACPNTVADKYLALAEKAGLEVLALETNATALYRAVVPAGSPAVVVLDMANTDTDLAIIYNDTPRLLRSVAVGGNSFLKSVSQGLGLDEVQADQFIRKFGMTQTKLEGQVYKTLKPSVDLLVDEVGKSLKFFASRYPDVKIEKIVLTGGSSQLLELPSYLANATRLPVEIANPWINISYPASMHERLLGLAHTYGVAAGLSERMFL
jgi:type IV pilus assembly protein PilM